MPAGNDLVRDGPETVAADIDVARDAQAPALARKHVRRALARVLGGRIDDAVLLTSEVVTNAVEYASAGTIELSVVRGPGFARIEVKNSAEIWTIRPAPRTRELDDTGGWGLSLVEQLSDRWGTRDSDTVWFEFQRPPGPRASQGATRV
jgi:anti-sigma regulatory factor (Ser/Thr protein kinase)